ncbi:tape measure protein [Ectopseudomonas oleovorans]|uniref:Putative tail length tape measure protein n=1 Tax=Ectopseudomonas oleovorans (strain CECT 5344) TaxID=1182590 RepID=W6RKN9_ECTO5|nr:tape measure protein [Pseudomonas oleovorans]CDM42384.1 putative tail length tape measure protein [Pseudomonas oleovorans CECT 5344]CDR93007.1 putative tail length tape measure protein [Pseudomonas oleovorans]
MANNGNLQLALRVQADLKQAVDALKQLDAGLDGVSSSAQSSTSAASTTGAALDRAGDAARSAAREGERYAVAAGRVASQSEVAARSLDQVTQKAGQGDLALSRMAKSIGAVAGSFIGLQALSKGIAMVDDYGQMADRIQMATESAAEYDQVQSRLLETAKATYRPLAEAQELYISTADALRSLNYTTSDSLDITDSFSYLLVTNAASADKANSAISAYAKAIQTGKVSSDQWQSLLGAMPTLVNAIAEATGKSTEEIRKLGIEGKLALDDLNESLRKSLEANKKAADGMGTTVADAMMRLSTGLTAYLGEANRSTELTATMAKAIDLLGENIETVANLFGVLAAGAMARYGAQLAVVTKGKLADVLASRAQIAEELRLAQAQVASTATAVNAARANVGLSGSHGQVATAIAAHEAATRRLAAAQAAAGTASRALMGFLGGPAGIAMLAASAAASFFLFRDSAEEAKVSLDDLSLSVEEYGRKWAEASKEQRRAMLDTTRQQLQQVQADINDSISKIDAALNNLASAGQVPINLVIQAMGDLRTAAENGGAGIDDVVQSIADLLPVGHQARSELTQLAGQLSTQTQSVTTLSERMGEFTGRLDDNTDALRRNSDELGRGSKEADEYLEKLRGRTAELLDPSAVGRAKRDLVSLKDATLDQVSAILAEAAAQDQLLEARNKTKSSRSTAETEAQRQAKASESYVRGLERQAALLGLNAAEVRAYEVAEKGLAGALLARAQAANELISAEERKRQSDANARTNADLEAEFLRSVGRDVDAGLLEIRTKFDAMRVEFERAGNEAGLAWLDKLIPVAEAKVRVDDVQRQMEKILEEQRRQESSVNVQQDAGLLTELQARERILQIHRQTYDQLQQIRPVLEEMARQPGAVGEAAANALAALDEQAQRLQVTTTLLAETLRDGLTTGFTDALTGLAKGTMDLRDAITALADGVLDAMVRMAAENLAQSATNGLMGMFTGITEAAPQAIAAVQQTASAQQAAITAVQTTQMAADTAMATSSATAAATTATAQAGAAATTTAAWTPAAITASIGSFGAAAAIGLAAVMAALAFKAFAGGGHVRGPGTTTSDSIPALLSDQEFVTRAAVVQQPGALPFLSDFNERGMVALDDWATRVRHATGGLAGVPAPAMPSPGLGASRLAEPASSMIQNSQTFNLIDSPERIASVLQTRAGEDALTVVLSRDPAKFRSILHLDR